MDGQRKPTKEHIIALHNTACVINITQHGLSSLIMMFYFVYLPSFSLWAVARALAQKLAKS